MSNEGSTDSECELCRQTKKLCRSHILPDFLYSEVYDESGKKMIVRSAIDHSEKFRQSGYWEWLLCGECESRTGEWDRYAANVLKGNVQLEGRREGAVVHLSGIDYAKFKLFQLSVVWRASIAKGEFFKRVILGPHEEVMRSMLLTGDPGPHTQYPCLITSLIMEGAPATGVIVEPTEGRLYGHRTYRFVFGGLLWVFIVTRQQVNPIPGYLLERGEISILVRDAMEFEYLTDLMARVIAPGRQGSQ